MRDFETAKKQLNTEQRQAVESIEGPVMVLAGPGTGKTEVVSLRIAEILNKTQATPGNILALTFTEAGVVALQKRLESVIGPLAYRVEIATFHSFANGIIQQLPYLFDFDDTANRITELEQFQLLEKIITDSKGLDVLKPIKSPFFRVRDILKAIKTCKQEAITPTMLKDFAGTELKESHEDTTLKKLDKERKEKSAQKNIELSVIYAAYQAELAKNNRYDYEDMILLLVKGLKENDNIRLYFQERYQYILVDEYQDTNNGQNELVFELASFFDKPNLCVVGDDKQAIYRFQGASVANILTFAQKYKPKIISLKNNYRSSPEILNSASELIKNNNHQIANYLKVSSELLATKKKNDTPLLLEAPNKLSEYTAIIKRIKEIRVSGGSLRNVAVLFRLNSDVRYFRELCYKFNLPVDGVIESDLLKEKEIQALVTTLKAIDNPLNELVSFPALMILSEAAEIDLLELRKEKGALVTLASKSKNKIVVTAARQLLDLHRQSQKISLRELLEEIMEHSRILTSIQSNSEQFARLEILAAFIAEARRFNERNISAKLADFLQYIATLSSYRISIPVNRSFEVEDGIFLSTIHSAKGLEFDTVFMPAVDQKTWLGRKKVDFIELPSDIVKLKNWQDDLLEDERRLFFVGMTRAKSQLILSHSLFSDDGGAMLPCQFVSEISTLLTGEATTLSVDEVQGAQVKSLLPVAQEKRHEQELQYIRDTIRGRPFSFTDLRTYLTCPRQFILRVVYGLQSEPTAALVYGSIVHKALELFFKAYKASLQLPSKAELLLYVDSAAKKCASIDGVERLIDEAKEVLGKYYDTYAETWHIPFSVELAVRNHRVMLGDIWLTGKIDRVDMIDKVANTARIIDYKTNTTTPSRNDIEGKTKSSDGLLKKQLVFYAMLADRDKTLPYKVTNVALDFINNTKFKQEDFTVTKEEIAELEAEVEAIFSDILAAEHFRHTRADYDDGCEVCAAFPEL